MRFVSFTTSLTLVLAGMVMIARAADDDVVARIGDQTITRSALEKEVKTQLIEIENSRYEALKSGLDRLVGERMLLAEAKERGITVDGLMAAEVSSKLTEPSDQQITEVYEANKEDLGEATLEQVRPQIVAFLKQREEALATRQLIETLRAKFKPEIALEAPRVEVATGDLERRGPAAAPVTIVAFSDYECPYCQRAENTIDEVITAYGDKIKYFHRDFPLNFHANARAAAAAARCANEQGKFWAYRSALFAGGNLGTERFRQIADETGVDRGAFDECLAADKFGDAIDRDMADGAEVGVNGTPAFFVNGRMLSGAQPFDAFKQIIDEELATQAKAD